MTHRRTIRIGAVPLAARISVGVATLIAVAAVVIGVLTGPPSYPHAWCGSVIAEISTRHSAGNEVRILHRLALQDHVPVGKLAADEDTYIIDEAAEQDASNLSALGDIATALGATDRVGADLKRVNAECGMPQGAYKKDYL